MRPKKRSVEKGMYTVEVDGEEYLIKGKKITKKGKNKTVVKFKAKGDGESSPIKRINDKLVMKNGLVKKNKKRTKFVKKK